MDPAQAPTASGPVRSYLAGGRTVVTVAALPQDGSQASATAAPHRAHTHPPRRGQPQALAVLPMLAARPGRPSTHTRHRAPRKTAMPLHTPGPAQITVTEAHHRAQTG